MKKVLKSNKIFNYNFNCFIILHVGSKFVSTKHVYQRNNKQKITCAPKTHLLSASKSTRIKYVTLWSLSRQNRRILKHNSVII